MRRAGWTTSHVCPFGRIHHVMIPGSYHANRTGMFARFIKHNSLSHILISLLSFLIFLIFLHSALFHPFTFDLFLLFPSLSLPSHFPYIDFYSLHSLLSFSFSIRLPLIQLISLSSSFLSFSPLLSFVSLSVDLSPMLFLSFASVSQWL